MSDPHPPHLPHGHRFDGEFVSLQQGKAEKLGGWCLPWDTNTKGKERSKKPELMGWGPAFPSQPRQRLPMRINSALCPQLFSLLEVCLYWLSRGHFGVIPQDVLLKGNSPWKEECSQLLSVINMHHELILWLISCTCAIEGFWPPSQEGNDRS